MTHASATGRSGRAPLGEEELLEILDAASSTSGRPRTVTGRG